MARYAWGAAISDFCGPGANVEFPPSDTKHRLIINGLEVDVSKVLVDYVDEEAARYRQLWPEVTKDGRIHRVMQQAKNVKVILAPSPVRNA